MSWFLYPCSMFWNRKNLGLPILLSSLRWFCGVLGGTSHWWSTCLVCGRPWLWHSALKKVLITVMLQILSYMSRPYYQFSQQRQLDSGRVHWICRSVCIAILTSLKLWTWDAVPVCSFFFRFLPCHLWFSMYKSGISFTKMFLDKFFFLILSDMKLLGVICFCYSVFHFLDWATLNSLCIPGWPQTRDALPECKTVSVCHRS